MLDAFIASVPKVELHLHLVGSASSHKRTLLGDIDPAPAVFQT